MNVDIDPLTVQGRRIEPPAVVYGDDRLAVSIAPPCSCQLSGTEARSPEYPEWWLECDPPEIPKARYDCRVGCRHL